MTTKLIIARHGNTFEPDETPRRVGARTDLELVEKGIVQATQLGTWLQMQDLNPQRIIAGPLKRTRRMAEIARGVMYHDDSEKPNVEIDERLREIDYGPDEDLREEEVVNRIGADAIAKWDQDAIVPEGWNVDPDELQKHWQDIANDITQNNENEIVLVVTSNGVARFAPYLTGNFAGFKSKFSLKLATGAVGILNFDGKDWQVEDWNIRPHKELEE